MLPTWPLVPPLVCCLICIDVYNGSTFSLCCSVKDIGFFILTGNSSLDPKLSCNAIRDQHHVSYVHPRVKVNYGLIFSKFCNVYKKTKCHHFAFIAPHDADYDWLIILIYIYIYSFIVNRTKSHNLTHVLLSLNLH